MGTLPFGTDWPRLLALDTPFAKIVGGGGTGKTLGLVQRVAVLLDQGVSPEDILLIGPTPAAVDALNALLDQEGVADVRATTLVAYAVALLDSPAARQATGRSPRLLADFEERILMEDMKVCGLKPKRLREMLKFFYRELSELGDEKDTFIRDSEEADVYATLTENLRLREAMLPQELSNVACKFVRDHPEAAAPFKRPFVLVDDFQNLNCASQWLVELLATRSLIITGAQNCQVATGEPYPYPQGFIAFEGRHEGAATISLRQGLRSPERLASMANALATDGGLCVDEVVETGTGAPCEVQFVRWPTPNEEFLGLARYIKHRLADTDHLIRPQDIFVAVPNAVWGNALAKVLRANDIKADVVTSRHALRGDPRDEERSRALQAYTRLNLAADDTDVIAWRSWCGFGDYLTNSNHWFRLEKYAQQKDIGVLEALEQAEALTEDELFGGASVLVDRYRAGKEFVARVKDKQGFALLNACAPVRGEEPPREFMDLVEPVEGSESAAQLLERARGRLEARFADTDAVRIGLMDMSCGLSFDTVIFAGAVEGFYPARVTIGVELDDERIEEIRRQERRSWYAAMTKARYAFIVSTVQKDEANTAAALGMYAHRIRMEDGKSMAVLAPTPYLDEMGDEAPGFVSTL